MTGPPSRRRRSRSSDSSGPAPQSLDPLRALTSRCAWTASSALDLRVDSKIQIRRYDRAACLRTGRTLRLSGVRAAFLRRAGPAARGPLFVRVPPVRRGHRRPARFHLRRRALGSGPGRDRRPRGRMGPGFVRPGTRRPARNAHRPGPDAEHRTGGVYRTAGTGARSSGRPEPDGPCDPSCALLHTRGPAPLSAPVAEATTRRPLP